MQAYPLAALLLGLLLVAAPPVNAQPGQAQQAPVAEIEAYLAEAAADQARDRALYGSLANPELLAGRESRLQARLAAQLNSVAAREAAYGHNRGQQAVAYISTRAPAFAAGGQRPGQWYENPYLARYGFGGPQAAPAEMAGAPPPARNAGPGRNGGGNGGGNASPAAVGEVWDPLEPLNRAFYAFNEVVDTFLMRPVAWLYSFAPDPVKTGLRNALSNLNAPVTFLNHGLQAEFNHAATTVGRFAVNSTVGVLGLWDAADDLLDWKGKPADFGQTLHTYGLGDGPFLMLPLLGPTNLRDGVGTGVDMLADPLTYILNDNARLALAGTKAVVRREALLVPLDELKAGSLDYYAALRSSSQQNRHAFLRDGKPADAATLKRTDDLFNEME